MSIKNVEIKKKANVYHGGNVTSRTLVTAQGEMKTMGVMLPGVYRFTTEAPETIEITQGECRVKIGDDQEWLEYQSGDTFPIPGNSHFEIEVVELLDYLCHFE